MGQVTGPAGTGTGAATTGSGAGAAGCAATAGGAWAVGGAADCGLRCNGIDVGGSSGRDDLRLVLDSGGFFGHRTLLFGLFADSGLDRYRSRRYNSGINRACQ